MTTDVHQALARETGGAGRRRPDADAMDRHPGSQAVGFTKMTLKPGVP
ncbi:hypothetical protein [Streptomyces sp. NPDC006285]